MKLQELTLNTSPFLKNPQDTVFIMWQVIYSLMPIIAASAFFFGIGALLIITSAVLGAMIPEYFFSKKRGKGNTLKDGSALITGILLGLTLPPTMPLWMAFLGGMVAILLGKSIFGGLGNNIFNPALVGRAFLQAAFPISITTWSVPGFPGNFFTIPKSLLAFPFCKGDYSTTITLLSLGKPVDAISMATPLGKMKFDKVGTDISSLFLGNTLGSLGETCALLILLCGVYLAIRGCLNWRIPAAILLSTFVFATILHHFHPNCAGGLFHILSGGIMLGAVFMATDMVTSPVTSLGCWIFGVAIGILVVVIRVFGGLPEGVMYAILIMNAFTPMINRLTQPKIYGT